jgi:hypothetical protein
MSNTPIKILKNSRLNSLLISNFLFIENCYGKVKVLKLQATAVLDWGNWIDPEMWDSNLVGSLSSVDEHFSNSTSSSNIAIASHAWSIQLKILCLNCWIMLAGLTMMNLWEIFYAFIPLKMSFEALIAIRLVARVYKSSMGEWRFDFYEKTKETNNNCCCSSRQQFLARRKWRLVRLNDTTSDWKFLHQWPVAEVDNIDRLIF